MEVLQNGPYEIMRACPDAEQIKDYMLGLEMNKELQQESSENKVLWSIEREKQEEIAVMVRLPVIPAKENTRLKIQPRNTLSPQAEFAMFWKGLDWICGGNLEPVAKVLREQFPNAAITVCPGNRPPATPV